VIIDRQSLKDSRGWIILSLLTLLLCSVAYFIYAARAPQGPSGGSWQGLTFGSIGTAIILFAWALTIRKWRRSARWGKAYTWLQGHVYLSIVSYPIILYHAGFHWGGPLTRVLMWAFTICYFSGLLVLLVQQIIPRMLLSDVPLETIYEQIDHVSRKNLAAADALVLANAAVAVAVPDLGEDEFQTTRTQRGPTRAGPGDLQRFYDDRVRPFLAQGLHPTESGNYTAVVATWAATAKQLMLPRSHKPPTPQEFATLRRQLTDNLSPVIDALEAYTEEHRQFALQKRMQHLLHGWLLIHVPASWIMIVLMPLHAVMAVRYL
jgi:hypothetical protein